MISADKSRIALALLVALYLVHLPILDLPISGLSGWGALAQEDVPDTFDWDEALQMSGIEDEGLEWQEGITASWYGSSSGTSWGGYGNRLHPGEDYFCALPASVDSLEYLGGHLGCRMSRCDDAQPVLDELLGEGTEADDGGEGSFEFWPGSGPSLGDAYSWVIEGTEGDGLFRVLEIKPAGEDGPVFEAYVGDVGPWCNSDPYWVDYSRPDAEDGVDARGRMTNRAGIDISSALAQAIGCTGLLLVDWRWKTVDGAYVVSRQPTEWRW